MIGVLAVIAVGVAGAIGLLRGLLDHDLLVEVAGATGLILANMWLVAWLVIAQFREAVTRRP